MTIKLKWQPKNANYLGYKILSQLENAARSAYQHILPFLVVWFDGNNDLNVAVLKLR